MQSSIFCGTFCFRVSRRLRILFRCQVLITFYGMDVIERFAVYLHRVRGFTGIRARPGVSVIGLKNSTVQN